MFLTNKEFLLLVFFAFLSCYAAFKTKMKILHVSIQGMVKEELLCTLLGVQMTFH